MSQYLQSYLINAADFKKLYGSKNNAALRKLTDMLADELDDLNEEFSEDINEDRTAEAVLADIMNGETRFPEIAYMYGFVFEKLCARFGKQFFPPNDEYATDYWQDVEKTQSTPFMPIPQAEGAPEMYSIAAADLEAEKVRFLAPPTRSGAAGKNFDTERADFEALFNKAIAEKKDIQFFLY